MLALAVGAASHARAQGRILVDTLHSEALRGNAIGDTPDRPVTIYLPPSYDSDSTRRFAVVYLLHGATSEPEEWLDGTYQGFRLDAALDQQAATAEYIVVIPRANNSFGGSFYVNSPAFGGWEDFVATELVRFIDGRYRTLPRRQSRILAGQSMGGFGALYLAGRHPETFAHVYAMSPCCLGFVGDLAPDSERWRGEPRRWFRAIANAFAPAPTDTSRPVPLPFSPGPDGRLRENRAVARAGRRYLPLERLKKDPGPYRRLCTIGIEAGRQDEIPNVPLGAAAFSRELSRGGIAHTYTEFTGGHVDHTRERFETAVLPFFARIFSGSGASSSCGVTPH